VKSLLELYSNLEESYYGIKIDTEYLFCNTLSHWECKNFIDKHFSKGEKHGVFAINEEFREVYDKEGKHQHTVSLYLLGLVLQSVFSWELRKKLTTLMNTEGWYSFKYSWYLTCLYHDVTSSIEKDIRYKDRIGAVEKSLLFQHKPMRDGVNLLRFPKQVLLNYLEYRRTQRSEHRNEHGVIGGTQLFDALYKSFAEKMEGWNWEERPEYREHNLKWRREHLDHFAYIADAVCCHNIWLADPSMPERYEQYLKNGLEALIVRQDEDKISMAEYPLQFMLCLLDTIEPIKKFEKLGVETILRNIYLKKDGDTLVITWGRVIEEQSKFDSWIESIYELPNWMHVNIPEAEVKESPSAITIEIMQ